MAEATLNISQSLRGDASRQIARQRKDIQRYHREQTRALNTGIAKATAMSRVWRGMSPHIRSAGRNLMAFGRSVFSLQTAFAGLALVGGAVAGGRTIFDKIIGPNAALERQLITFRTLIGDVEKAEKLVKNIERMSAETPFEQNDLIESSRRLLRLTGDNIAQNQELLRLSTVMAAVSNKTVVEASEALLDAEQGEMERLKEFGIKLRVNDFKKQRKSGQALGQAILLGVADAMEEQTGGRDVVGALAKSYDGRMSTLRDSFNRTLRDLGKPAFKVISDGLVTFNTEWEKLKASPEFESQLKSLSTTVEGLAKWGVSLVTRLPEGIEKMRALVADARTFWTENKDTIKLLAGGFALNKATGGAIPKALFAGAKGLASGGGGGLMGSLAGAAGGAQPVYVTNWEGSGVFGAGGKSGDDGLGNLLGKASGGKGLSGFAAGLGTTTAGLGAAVGGIGLLVGSLVTLQYALSKTQKAAAGFKAASRQDLIDETKADLVKDVYTPRPMSQVPIGNMQISAAAQERIDKRQQAIDRNERRLSEMSKLEGALVGGRYSEAAGTAKRMQQQGWNDSANNKLNQYNVEMTPSGEFRPSLQKGDFDVIRRAREALTDRYDERTGVDRMVDPELRKQAIQVTKSIDTAKQFSEQLNRAAVNIEKIEVNVSSDKEAGEKTKRIIEREIRKAKVTQ